MADSIGGNSKTIMIANIAPSKNDIALTRETLKYAVQTGTISNKPSSMGAESKLLKLKEKEHLEKLKIIDSIIRSQKIIPKNAVKNVLRSVSIPDVASLADKSLEELRNLKIAQLEYQDYQNKTISFILNDG
jgi:hypothetical protein